MENIIIGLIIGAVLFGLFIRWILAAIKPPIIHASPVATATANAYPGGGVAEGERKRSIPIALLAALAIMALCIVLAVNGIQAIAQRFAPERIITIAPVAQPQVVPQMVPQTIPQAIPQSVPRVATVEIPHTVPDAAPQIAPTMIPIVTPIAPPAPDMAPAWLTTLLEIGALVVAAVWGGLAIMLARPALRRLAFRPHASPVVSDPIPAPNLSAPIIPQPQFIDYFDDDAPRDSAPAHREGSDLWNDAIPDTIYDLEP